MDKSAPLPALLQRRSAKKRRVLRTRALLLCMDAQQSAFVVGRRPNKERKLMVWAERLEFLDDKEFVRRYRLNKSKFAWLARLLRPKIESTSKHRDSSKTVIAELKLSITIRYMCGGAAVDIADLHGINAHATFYKYVNQTVTAICACEELDLPLLRENGDDLLSDIRRLRPLEREYNRRTATDKCPGGVMTGCFGALDGVAIKIRAPVKNATAYYCRKGFHSLNVQAVCDSNRRVLWVSVVCSGSTHDCTAFHNTKLAQILRDPDHELAKSDLWLAGDDAYTGNANDMHGSLITPYRGTLLDDEPSAFNFYQSSLRISIEVCFYDSCTIVLYDRVLYYYDRILTVAN